MATPSPSRFSPPASSPVLRHGTVAGAPTGPHSDTEVARPGTGPVSRRGRYSTAALRGAMRTGVADLGSAGRTRCPRHFRPRIRRDYPLDLSISASGGKETNQDSLSSGERTGRSPAPNPVGGSRRPGNVVFGRVRSSRSRFSERRLSGRRPGPVHGPNAASGPKKPRPGTASPVIGFRRG